MKITRLLVAGTTFLFLPSLAIAAFLDVPSTHPNADAIAYVQEKGIVQGYADGTFHADAAINRAEFTKIVTLYKFGQKMIDMCGSRMQFTDLAFDAWYVKYICRAKDGGLINGYPDGTFRPGQNINFAEAAKIIARTDTFNAGDPTLPEDTGGPWYDIYLQYLSRYSAIPLSISRIDDTLTRGEMAEIIYRLQNKGRSFTSQKYDSSSGKIFKGTSSSASLSQEKIYTFNETVLKFQVPADWPHETQVGPAYSNGGIPYGPSLWRLNLGTLCRGCAEGSDEYTFTIDAYEADPALPGSLNPDHLIQVLRDDMQDSTRVIVYSEGGICGNIAAFFITGKTDYRLQAKCGADSKELSQQFDLILKTMSVTVTP